MARYLVTQNGAIKDEVEGKSMREAIADLPVGAYSIYTVKSAKSVQVREVTTTEVVVEGDSDSWATEEEE